MADTTENAVDEDDPRNDPRNDPRDDPRQGLGSLVLGMMSLWMGPAVDPDDFDDLPRRVGPAIIVLWTAVGIALGTLVSGLRLAFGAHGPISYAAVVPMFLPLLLATVRLPQRRAPALAATVVTLAVVGIGGAMALSTAMETPWAVFVALSAATLLAGALYAAIARPA